MIDIYLMEIRGNILILTIILYEIRTILSKLIYNINTCIVRYPTQLRGCRGRMVVGITTTYDQ